MRIFETTLLLSALLLILSTADHAAAQNCDPNYANACVPIASDVNCAGGTGNGPEYVVGPVIVVGVDTYGLDRDNNGIGCENG